MDPFGLVGKKRENLVSPQGAAYTASHLVELLRVSKQVPLRRWIGGAIRRQKVIEAGPVVSLIRIQPRAICLEKRTAMHVIGAALRRDLNLRTAEPAVLRVIPVGHNPHIIDRILCWGNDGRAAPNGARSADAIDRDAIALVLATVGQRLGTVLSLKDAAVGARSTRPLCARQRITTAARALRRIPGSSGGKLGKLKNVTPK